MARQLAADYPYERVIDVVATMEYRKARGKCDNPGGFIREALVKQWQTPKAVVDARRRAEAKLRQQAADEQARAAAAEEQARQQATAGDEEGRVERLIAGLDDEELEILAGVGAEEVRGQLGRPPGPDPPAAAPVPADEDGDRRPAGRGEGR